MSLTQSLKALLVAFSMVLVPQAYAANDFPEPFQVKLVTQYSDVDKLRLTITRVDGGMSKEVVRCLVDGHNIPDDDSDPKPQPLIQVKKGVADPVPGDDEPCSDIIVLAKPASTLPQVWYELNFEKVRGSLQKKNDNADILVKEDDGENKLLVACDNDSGNCTTKEPTDFKHFLDVYDPDFDERDGAEHDFELIIG